MKKFSKVVNQNIKQPPQLENRLDESEEFKFKIMSLMEQFLRVQSYGPVDNRYLAGKVKIEGKEVLAEALLDLFSETSNKKQKAILESLKSEVKDWKFIDGKIESLIENEIRLTNKFKFKRMIERYDESSILLFIEKNVDRISDKKTLKEYKIMTERSNFTEETKKSIIRLYEKRIESL